jgi:hypothetical protein
MDLLESSEKIFNYLCICYVLSDKFEDGFILLNMLVQRLPLNRTTFEVLSERKKDISFLLENSECARQHQFQEKSSIREYTVSSIFLHLAHVEDSYRIKIFNLLLFRQIWLAGMLPNPKLLRSFLFYVIRQPSVELIHYCNTWVGQHLEISRFK